MINSKKITAHFFSMKNLLGLIVSIVCIYWSFSSFNREVFVQHVKSINYYFFLLASLLLIFTVFIRSIRWYLFFSDDESKKIHLFALFKNEMIGYFGNNIFPLRLGDLLRVSKLSKVINLSQSYLLGTIVLERIIDIFSLLLLCLLFLPFFWGHELIFKLISEINLINFNTIYLYVVVVVIILLMMYFFVKKSNIIDLSLFISAFSNINNYKKFFMVILLSLFIWIIYLLNIIIISHSMINVGNLTILESFLLLFFITFSIVVLPSAPGTVGTFQAAVIFIMTSSLFNYDRVTALSFSIILHAYSYITYSLIGGYFFLKSNINLGK